jgi:hypothetical protein
MESKEENINIPKKVIEGMQTNTPSTPKLPTTPSLPNPSPSSSYSIPWSSICFTLIFLLLVGGGAYYYFVIMKKDTSVIDNALTPEYAPVQAVQAVVEANE